MNSLSLSASGALTLPKDFRYQTPEPSSGLNQEALPPSPPRPPRLRLKRRHVSSQIHAPTQHFLASVAAVDRPVPSIEEPTLVDDAMVDFSQQLPLPGNENIDMQRLYARRFTAPKTPGVEVATSAHVPNYPDWSLERSWTESDMESSPEYESSRPSTAFSTQTSSSLFSQYTRASSDADGDSDCHSPLEQDTSFDNQRDVLGECDINAIRPRPKGKSRRAPWTKHMSDHLWSTYLMYLQDPRVTPVRLGNSGIPPSGVCARVARQAKRSWKGPKVIVEDNVRSGSSTPRAAFSLPYIQWPHHCAATRAHLRELCKKKGPVSSRRTTNIFASPAPPKKGIFRRQRVTYTPGAARQSAFSAQDLSVSLALSTSETMKADGPLAQLTNSTPSEGKTLSSREGSHVPFAFGPESVLARPSLPSSGSPFSKSFGPSSSSSAVPDVTGRPRSHTVGGGNLLKSPIRLARSKSGNQKKRPIIGPEHQHRKRPSLPGSFWMPSRDKSRARSSSPTVVTPKLPTDDPFTSTREQTRPSRSFVLSGPSSAAQSRSARLGSPFAFSTSSHSVPSRLSQPVNFNFATFRRPFSTTSQSSTSQSEASSTRSSLAARLAQIDRQLKRIGSRPTLPP